LGIAAVRAIHAWLFSCSKHEEKKHRKVKPEHYRKAELFFDLLAVCSHERKSWQANNDRDDFGE
jgi:hypothetical protein